MDGFDILKLAIVLLEMSIIIFDV